MSTAHANGPWEEVVFFYFNDYLGLGVDQFWITKKTRLLSL